MSVEARRKKGRKAGKEASKKEKSTLHSGTPLTLTVNQWPLIIRGRAKEEIALSKPREWDLPTYG